MIRGAGGLTQSTGRGMGAINITETAGPAPERAALEKDLGNRRCLPDNLSLGFGVAYP